MAAGSFPRNARPSTKPSTLLLEELRQPIESVLLLELDDDELIQNGPAQRGRDDDNEAVIPQSPRCHRANGSPCRLTTASRKLACAGRCHRFDRRHSPAGGFASCRLSPVIA